MSEITQVAAWLRGYRKAIEGAARTVAYHCDCKHANVPGLVRLLAANDALGVSASDARRDLARERSGQPEAALRVQNDLALERLERVQRLEEALQVALEAMQANIAYATRKDEHALARGIEAARAVLAAPGKGHAP